MSQGLIFQLAPLQAALIRRVHFNQHKLQKQQYLLLKPFISAEGFFPEFVYLDIYLLDDVSSTSNSH